MTDLDRPDIAEVLQEETTAVAIPVRIPDPVRVDVLPTELVDPVTYVIFPGVVQRLLRRDPRRARATIIVANKEVMTSGRAGGLDKYGPQGILWSGIPVPIHVQASSELFCRPVDVNLTGADAQFSVATDVAMVTVLEERWAR